MCRFADRRSQSLTRHLEQAKATDLAYLDARAVLAHGLAQPILDVALMPRWAHIDEIDDDETAKVTNAQLAGDFLSCFQVRVQRGGFDVATFGGARRVDVDRHECLGVVDDDAAARRQVYRMGKSGLDLRFDLEAREQRHRVLVMLQLLEVVRHRGRNVLDGVLVGLVVVDQDFADLVRQVIAQGPHD